MKANFQKALKAVLVHEAGYVNNPHDNGGPTNRGITWRVYDAWRERQGLPKRSVRLIDAREVEAIYREQYWDAVRGDELPLGVDYVVFDGAVNSGPGQSIKWLQRALTGYTGPIDGSPGVRTLRRVGEDDDNDALIDRICDRRMAYLHNLSDWKHFGKGWTKRVSQVRAFGQAQATGKQTPKQSFVDGGNMRAMPAQVVAPPAKGGADALTGVGVSQAATGGTGLTALVNSTQEQLGPFASYSDYIAYACAGMIGLGLVLAVGGLTWRGIAVLRGRRLEAAVG